MSYLLIAIFLVGQNGEINGRFQGEFNTLEECVYFKQDLLDRKDISNAVCVEIDRT
jgi:hypothetical protein